MEEDIEVLVIDDKLTAEERAELHASLDRALQIPMRAEESMRGNTWSVGGAPSESPDEQGRGREVSRELSNLAPVQ